MKVNVGIDLGGTKILVVVLDENMRILSRSKDKVERGVSPDETALGMRDLCSEALKKAGANWSDVLHLGISIPSSVDPLTGEAFHSPALGWKNVPIRKTMTNVFGITPVIENDVNCGVIAEHALGAAKKFKSVVAYFVGTGLGGGIVINNELFTGSHGVAGELGHEIVEYGGRKCGCGKRGCIEAYCSKTAFARRLEKAAKDKDLRKKLKKYFGSDFDDIKSSQIRDAYEDGNKCVKKIINEGFYMLGIAAANIVSILDPECIVFGGGVVEALGDVIMKPVIEGFRGNVFALEPSKVYLAISELGDDAVPLGAAINAIRASKKPHN